MARGHVLRREANGGPKGKLIGSARVLRDGLPTPEDLENAGLEPKDCTTPNEDGVYYDLGDKAWRCQIWPENWPALQLYLRFRTQWRVGFNGPVGLDYNVILHELDRRNLDPDAYDDIFDAVRVIEDTLLEPKPA